MTLIIAGHHFKKGIDWAALRGSEQKDRPPVPLEVDGLFFAADSIITSGRQALLGGFRKVYGITAKLWKPYFVGEYFQKYLDVHSQVECVIAFAGSTLTAQHVLNSITSHLEQLRISYERADQSLTPGKYVVVRHCQKNTLEQGQGVDTWDEDMFLPKDMENLLTADVVAETVEYSINEALRSARRYKIDAAGFQSLYTEFALGVRCPVKRDYRLYCFRIEKREEQGVIVDVFTRKAEIAPGGLAVLGRVQDFASDAQVRFDAARAAFEEPTPLMFDYLNDSIRASHAQGRKDIDWPSSLKVYGSQGLALVDREDAS